MKKLIATLICGLLAASAQAQTTATEPAIGQAVSGNNATASGVSGTGLKKNGKAVTRSHQGKTAREAAGIDKNGNIVHKSTSVIGVAPGKETSVNAQATNTTAPRDGKADAKATGGRGEEGTLAEHKILKADERGVKTPPAARLKTEKSAKASREKHARVHKENQRKLEASPAHEGGGQH